MAGILFAGALLGAIGASTLIENFGAKRSFFVSSMVGLDLSNQIGKKSLDFVSIIFPRRSLETHQFGRSFPRSAFPERNRHRNNHNIADDLFDRN